MCTIQQHSVDCSLTSLMTAGTASGAVKIQRGRK